MYTEMLSPRFCETDALGHVNNTVLPVWFEKAREPIFRLFNPDLNINNWKLIIARIDVEFRAQLYYGADVELRTEVKEIGNSSIVVHHEVWQKKVLCAVGSAVLIHFDYQKQQAVTVPDFIRQELGNHLVT